MKVKGIFEMKKIFVSLTALLTALCLSACGAGSSTAQQTTISDINSTTDSAVTTQDSNITSDTAVSTTVAAVTTASPEPVEKGFQKTAVQAQEVRYIPIEEVGAYNKDIITDELLDNCELPALDKANLPYFTGYVLENKISVNYGRGG
jgi:hypothetical protein